MAKASNTSKDNLPSLRVVMIDDRRDSRLPIERFLTSLGHEVRPASDGTTGIALVQDFLPQLVICDIGLPDIDGYEVARRLRNEASTASITLLALTGYVEPEDRERALSSGFDEHLVKPVELNELERLLRKLLG